MDNDMATRVREAFTDIDLASALSLTFNKCPKCKTTLVRGSCLRWCPDRACAGYIGPLNKALDNKIEQIKPITAAEREQLQALAAEFGVETS